MSRQTLEQVRDELIDCDAVNSHKEFCESWLAKDESYMRGLRFRDLQPSADALATCASKLAYYAHHLGKSSRTEHQQLGERLAALNHLCQQALEQQARSKWMTPPSSTLEGRNRQLEPI